MQIDCMRNLLLLKYTPYRNMIYPVENNEADVTLPACETPEKEMRPVGVPDDF